MNGIFYSNERESKRWVILLAVACLACTVWVIHGVMVALKPASAIAHEAKGPIPVKVLTTGGFSDLSSPVSPDSRQMYAPIPTNVIERVLSPEEARAAYVHKQAAWLRQMAADPGARKAIGYLTPGQIDDMEKKGITVE